MKNLVTVLFLVFTLISVSDIYSQPKQKKVDVYICRLDGKSILIDENYTFIDSNYIWDDRNKSMESLVKEYIGKSREDYFFTEYKKWQKDFTGINLGEEFHVSTPKEVHKGKITGYKLWNNEPMGYEFSPVIGIKDRINEDTINYDNNIFICSRYKNMSAINNKSIVDKKTLKKVTSFLYSFTDNLKYEQGYVGEGDHGETKVFEANFFNSDKKEYAVSYVKRTAFDKYASGIFIVSEAGEIIKTVVEFNTEFNYYKLLGVIDYNGDGQYELLGESGYYEGLGYELYKINNDGKYEIIASGFYWGV